MEASAARSELVAAILDADPECAGGLVAQFAEEHGAKDTLAQLLEPALARIGEMWASGGASSLAQNYLAAKIAEEFISRLAAESTEVPSDPKGTLVVGNIEDDFHALGRRLVTALLCARGWEVHDLGNDVVPREFVDTALRVGARIIGVSAMMDSTARNIAFVREEIDRRGLAGRIQLAVGGAVFTVRPELAGEVGADAMARNALEAYDVMIVLQERAIAAGDLP